jgi:alkylated DNA repair dioxygenase AlkB
MSSIDDLIFEKDLFKTVDDGGAFETLKKEATWINKANTPRDECFMSNDPTITYSYGNRREERLYTPSPMHPIVESVMLRINTAYDLKFNVCVLNYYESEKQHLGWHADDSPEQDLTHPIAVVSFGAEREIWVKEKGFKGDIPPENRFSLSPGSLFLMPGGFQDNHYHKIPKPGKKCEGRISLTYRLIPNRKD